MRVVVVGAGEVGRFLAGQLSTDGNDVIVVDRDAALLARTEEDADVLTFPGDATHRRVLRGVDVAATDLVVAVTGSDETNVVASALASSMGAHRTVARVDSPAFYETSEAIERGVLGVDALLCVSRLVGQELLRQVMRIDVEFVASFARDALLVGLVAARHSSAALGRNPGELKLPPGARVSALLRDGRLRARREVSRIELDDRLLVSAPRLVLTSCVDVLNGRSSHGRTVVVGGGDVGQALVQSLLATGRKPQLIERDLVRCQALAHDLEGLDVVHGDGTSLAVLRDQQVEGAELVLAVTGADEVNLMASLVAADLGVPSVFALVHRPGYAEVCRHLGIRGTAGPHVAIAEAVHWLLPHRGPVKRCELPGGAFVLVEHAVDHPLAPADLGLPVGAVIVAAVQPNGLATDDGAPLEAGAHLVVAAPRGAERVLSGALHKATRRAAR